MFGGEFGGVFALTGLHRLFVLRRFVLLALIDLGLDAAVVFGHTHMPEHEELDGFQIFNPGSPTERRRAPAHTMGVATVGDGPIAFELHVLG